MGGFRAVSWTDFFQGMIMVVALVAMPLLVVGSIGGYGVMLDRLAAIDPALVTVTGNRTGFALFGFMTGLLGIGLGYPGQPHVLTRYMAASGDEKIRQTQVIAMIWGVLVFYGSGVLGLAGRLAMPGLGDPEQLFPLLARQMLHPLIAGVMLAAILSAIMSTVSSQLLVAPRRSAATCARTSSASRGGCASVLASRIAVGVPRRRDGSRCRTSGGVLVRAVRLVGARRLVRTGAASLAVDRPADPQGARSPACSPVSWSPSPGSSRGCPSG
jgi:hypothetical protein